MKISTFVLFIALLSASSLQAQNSRLVAQSDYNYITNAFVIGDTTTYFFTGTHGGDLTHALKYSTALAYTHYAHGSELLDSSSLVQQSFDGNDNISLSVLQQWDTSAGKWANTKQTFHSYDANNNDTLAVVQSYNPTSMKWFNTSRDRIPYSNNKITSLTFQLYDTTKMQWNNNTMFSYTYTGNNETGYLIQSWNIANSSWANGYRYLYYYDSQNNDTSAIAQIYHPNTSTWVNFNKQVATYGNGNNPLISYVLNWDSINSSFSDSASATFYKYDAHNNDTSLIQQFYSGGKWYNESKNAYRYNSSNQQTYAESLNPDGSGFVPVKETFYYYEDFNGINTPGNTAGNLQLYPNPSSDFVHLNLTLAQEQSVQLSLFNLLGQQVWTSDMGIAKRIEATIPVNNLQSGMYVLTINAGGVLQERKVIVSR